MNFRLDQSKIWRQRIQMTEKENVTIPILLHVKEVEQSPPYEATSHLAAQAFPDIL
jgi:hypothetical protein